MRSRPSRSQHASLKDVALRERIRDALDLRVSEQGYTLSFDRCLSAHVGLSVRKPQAARQLRKALKSYASTVLHEASWSIELASRAMPDCATILNTAAAVLGRVALQPLTARQILEALPITNRERLRWTKDGRLRRAGSASIRRGQLISIPTYDVAYVEMVSGDPTVISGWRSAGD